MIEFMGAQKYREMLCKLTIRQLDLLTNEGGIKYSGTFFDYRGSMLNWCPIGRSASQRERELWSAADLNDRIRKPILLGLEEWLSNRGIAISLGGSTSFDIYPTSIVTGKQIDL